MTCTGNITAWVGMGEEKWVVVVVVVVVGRGARDKTCAPHRLFNFIVTFYFASLGIHIDENESFLNRVQMKLSTVG